jgi:hypothetical protein
MISFLLEILSISMLCFLLEIVSLLLLGILSTVDFLLKVYLTDDLLLSGIFFIELSRPVLGETLSVNLLGEVLILFSGDLIW